MTPPPYWEKRILEALELAHRDEGRATRLVMGWTAQDHSLLLGVTRPHLAGLVAYAVHRIAARSDEAAAPEEPPPQRPVLDDLPGDDFGKEILKAVAFGQPARFGREAFSAPPGPRRPKASQQHIEAIRKIATPLPPDPRKPDSKT